MKQQQESIGGYRLASISEVSSFVDKSKYPSAANPEDHRLNFNVDFKVTPSESRIFFRLGIDVGHTESGTFSAFLGSNLQFVFEVEHFDKVVFIRKGESDSIACKKILLESFVGIAIGALRGFLNAKTQSVIINGYLLTLFDTSELTELLFKDHIEIVN